MGKVTILGNKYFCNEWECPFRENIYNKEKSNCDLVFHCPYIAKFSVDLGER